MADGSHCKKSVLTSLILYVEEKEMICFYVIFQGTMICGWDKRVCSFIILKYNTCMYTDVYPDEVFRIENNFVDLKENQSLNVKLAPANIDINNAIPIILVTLQSCH